MGPTACGKTDLAAALSERFRAELVNVDAAQVYRGMDIGTAKPAPAFLARHPHHLIDFQSPAVPYSAADFVADAGKVIEGIRHRGAIPLLVGGTMFYFRALLKGLSPLPPADPVIRLELARELAGDGAQVLHARLAAVDPQTAGRIDPADTQRILRALEIHRATGRPPSDLLKRPRGLAGGATRLALFCADRAALHRRIEQRFRHMLDNGLEAEVAGLARAFPQALDNPAMRTVGYRQVLNMLRGDIDRQTMFDSAVAATRQLAKRQLTWLRQQGGLVWVPADGGKALDTVTRYLKAHPDYRPFDR